MKYNIVITKPIGAGVDRVIKYFAIDFEKTIRIIKQFMEDGYNLSVTTEEK